MRLLAEQKEGTAAIAKSEVDKKKAAYDQADSEWLDSKREALFGEWQAGKISAEEQQRQRAALSGADALRKDREERLAKAAELKQAAEQAKAAAGQVRAAAEAAR